MKIVDVAEFYAEQGGGVRTYVNHKLRAAAAAGHEAVATRRLSSMSSSHP